jgi:hypothetical protein
MAFDLSSITSVQADMPPRIVLYGTQGIGKTSLASEMPAPVFLQTEEGTPYGKEIKAFPPVTTYKDVTDAITTLATGDHPFKTLVIDTIDALEPIIFASVCADNNWRSIEDPGYGKGYVEAETKWRNLLHWLNSLRKSRKMNIVYLGHSEIVTFQPPGLEPYARYQPKLHKRSMPVLIDDADIVAFANYHVELKKTDVGFNKQVSHAEGGGTRLLFFEERPAYVAKNRYGLGAYTPLVPGGTAKFLLDKTPMAR